MLILPILLTVLSVLLPNPAVTPGRAVEMTPQVLCATKWGLDKRHVTEKMKKQVAKAYGVKWEDRRHYEFDHLISRELAGADDVANLWPQPLVAKWNAHQKDVLENTLHRLVCKGELSLGTAQEALRTDWITAYRYYVKK